MTKDQRWLKKLAGVSLWLILLLGTLNAAALKGPYLIYDGINTEMKVLWQLDSTQSCTIDWGTDTSYTSGSATSSESGNGNNEHQHIYTIAGLTPGTYYLYRANCTQDNVGNGSFNTAPSDTAVNVKLLVYGDTRSYPSDHNAVNYQMINTYTTDPDYQTLTLHSGDWVANADSESDWTNQYFDTSYQYMHQFQANMPVNGIRGNHEGSGDLFLKYFPYPRHSGSFYWSYDYGPVHVAVIDQYSDYSTGSTQYNWLQNDLASSTKKWKFIILHEPGWSAGGHSNNADVQNYIQPLAIANGVTMVFAGHNHYYARADVNGIQHITTGGGGAPLYSADPSSEYILATSVSHHFCEVEIQGDDLYFTAVDKNGTVLDSFHLNSAADITPPVITVLGDNPLNLQVGNTFTDPGATAQDNVDGDVTASIQATNDVDTSTAGSYNVTYSVTDEAGNTATATRSVVVTETFTVQSRVSAGTDDAEEHANGTMYLNSSDLEMVYDPYVESIQNVGMRFANITVPQGAIITRAYIQFKVDEATSENTQLSISGQGTDNAATFSSAEHDISARIKTSASVSWAPAAWNSVGAVGETQRTPDLSSVIQEIVSGTGWQDSNAIALVVTGSGKRVAESFDGDQAGAPLLYIEYTTGGGMDTTPPVAVLYLLLD